jgi:hypothetical protein
MPGRNYASSFVRQPAIVRRTVSNVRISDAFGQSLAVPVRHYRTRTDLENLAAPSQLRDVTTWQGED